MSRSIVGVEIWSLIRHDPLLLVLGLIAVRVLLRVGQRVLYPGRMVDRRRLFNRKQKHEILRRAGGRCEGRILWFWRCPARNELKSDHIHPWSRTGQTEIANGQALCELHNTLKWARVPFWWNIAALEWRRRKYFPARDDPTVVRLGPASTLKRKPRRRRRPRLH